jgi:hypothetical protein
LYKDGGHDGGDSPVSGAGGHLVEPLFEWELAHLRSTIIEYVRHLGSVTSVWWEAGRRVNDYKVPSMDRVIYGQEG